MKAKASVWLAAAVCAVCASWGSVASATDQARSRYVPVYMPAGSVSAGPASATTHSNSTAGATSSSQGGSAQGVGSQGQSLSIDSHAVYEAQERNPASTAIAPALTSSNDTCMGSTSVGASAVSFGFSFGSSWTDNNCLMLKNSRELWNMGFKGAAMARMCMDDLNKEALEATGVSCPNSRRNARGSRWGNNSANADNRYRD